MDSIMGGVENAVADGGALLRSLYSGHSLDALIELGLLVFLVIALVWVMYGNELPKWSKWVGALLALAYVWRNYLCAKNYDNSFMKSN